jgi:hypothetical protein
MERDTRGCIYAYEKRQSPFTVLRAVGMACGISNCLSYRCLSGYLVSNLYPTYQRVMVIKGKAQGNDWRAALCRGLMFERNTNITF